MRHASLAALLCLFLAAPALAVGPVLVVDDDGGWNREGPYVQALQGLGTPATVWSVRQQGLPPLAQLTASAAVLWVAGGFGTPTWQSQRLMEQYLAQGGRLLLGGQNAARAIQYSFVLQGAFGIRYQGTTGFGAPIYPSFGGFGQFQARTDYGDAFAMDAMYLVDVQGPGTAQRLACATRRHDFAARAVWLGFDLTDVWPSWSQRDVVAQSLRFLETGWRPDPRQVRFEQLWRDAD